MLLRNKLLLLSQGYITCSKPYGSLWTVIKTEFWPQDIVVYSRKKNINPIPCGHMLTGNSSSRSIIWL